ncbi:hypothetical protein ABZY31_24075 [Streptomyces sp. NPDC006529]|uniref:hypothetical protein n=1 Tax=Streptomyces sp. NPDC006529 TaxID=3157177 RepID=UPI00339EB9F9
MIAKDLRVSVRLVERRRRAWREGGMGACVRQVRRTHRPSPMPSSPCWICNSTKARRRTASKTNAGPWSGSRW